MYPVSADFHNLSIADAPTSRVRIYFIEANVDCTDDNDVQTNGTLLCMPGETDSNGRIEKGGVTINEFFNSDTNVQIGATVSSQIGMTLINRDGALDGFNYGRCKLYIDVYDDTNSTWLTCPMGVYNIAIPKRRKVQLVSATGYDQMQQLDEIADSWWNGLDWSNGITLLQIIQSMAATLGIHLSANTSANIVNSGLSYTEIPFTSIEMTYRDILSYIAETTGTIARFDRNGALDLRWFSDAVLSTDTQTYAGGLVTFTATDRASISSLSVPFSPIQDLHGYSSPWPAGGGKNKFYYPTSFNTTGSYGLVYKYDKDTETFSITGTSTHTSAYIALFLTAGAGTATPSLTVGQTCYIYHNLPTGTYLNLTYFDGNGVTKAFSIIGGAAGTGDYVQRSLIVPNDYVSFTQVQIGVYGSATQINKTDIHIALGTDSAFTEWTPYSNICPISGRTGLSVYDDPKYGGSIDFNQYADNESTTGNHFAETWATTLSIANGVITATNTRDFTQLGLNFVENDVLIQGNHVFLCSFDVVSVDFTVSTVTVNITDHWAGLISTQSKTYTGVGTYSFIAKTYAGGTAGNAQRMLIQLNGSVTTGDKALFKNCLWFDLTQMFGETKADEILAMEQAEAGSGVAYFKTLFYKDYYPYNSGTITCVSAVNGDLYWKKDIDWTSTAGTVYGGSLDVVTGVLTIDRGFYTFNGTEQLAPVTAPANVGGFPYFRWYSSSFTNVFTNWATTEQDTLLSIYPTEDNRKYWYSGGTNNKDVIGWTVNTAAGICIKDVSCATASDLLAKLTGQTLCYKLATPLTYQLTAQEIEALVGTNNVWSTGDSVSVTVSEPNLVEIQTDTVGNQCLSIDVGEYQVSQIDALSVKASQADVGVTIGSGGNAYTILDNPMLFGDEAAITTKATPIYNRLSAFRLFTPISMRCIMDWSIEAGDIITVTNESVTYDLPIFQQRLRWRGGYVVSDLFSNGEQERPTQSKEIRSSFRSNTQMHEFEVTLEQLRSYIQSVDGNYTLIQQTVDAITQTVANQNVTIQNILDPTGEIWTAITKNTSNLSSIEDSLNNEITERKSYIRFIPSEPAIVMGVDEDNEIKLKLVNNIIYFFNGADDSTDLSLAYAYFNSQEAFADRFVAGESVQIGTNDNAAHWLWKKLNNGDLVLELVG